MKSFKTIIESPFSVDWKNIEEETLNQSKRVYSLYDYNEDSILFI
ncbi:hypothetical protein [Seonamhaeicola maritimus]|nr:hypothetical protein [Seonamhaeicola maritimus]